MFSKIDFKHYYGSFYCCSLCKLKLNVNITDVTETMTKQNSRQRNNLQYFVNLKMILGRNTQKI